MRSISPRITTSVIATLLATVLTGAAVAASGSGGGPSGTVDCSRALAAPTPMSYADHRACVIAVASTYLDAEQHSLSPADVLFDPAVSIYKIGTAPQHSPGNAGVYRAQLRASTTTRAAKRQWTVDGNEAFVAYDGYTKTSATKPAYYLAERFLLRGGLIWEILQTPMQVGSPALGGFPNTPAVLVTGPPAKASPKPNPSDPFWCTDWIGIHGDRSLPLDQHKRCMIAIASTYVNAEENSTPGNQILFDPRFSRYSLGGQPMHGPSNSDLIRTQEGRYQGTYNRVIRKIKHRQWTVDADQAWIVYDGYLVVSTTHPGFHVAERFTIHNGLIWQIMIAPVTTSIP